MTKQEKWDQLVSKIESLGEELQELFEDSKTSSENIESALYGLRLTVDELSEQEIE